MIIAEKNGAVAGIVYDDAEIADDLALLAKLRDVHAPAALKGDPQATRMVLRIIEMRQRLRRFRDQRRAAAEKARQPAPPQRSAAAFQPPRSDSRLPTSTPAPQPPPEAGRGDRSGIVNQQHPQSRSRPPQ